MNDDQTYLWRTTAEGKVYGGWTLMTCFDDPYPELLEAWERHHGSPVVELGIGGLSDDPSEHWGFAYDRRTVTWKAKS